MTQQTQYVFRISKVITPNQVSQALRDTKISTQDKLGNDIDTTSNCATDAIGIPKVLNQARFAIDTSTPGTLAVATVGFTTGGQVDVGGHISVTFPFISHAVAMAN